jgi:hypothetical protein
LILCEFRWLMRSWGRNIFWTSNSELKGSNGQAEVLFKKSVRDLLPERNSMTGWLLVNSA